MNYSAFLQNSLSIVPRLRRMYGLCAFAERIDRLWAIEAQRRNRSSTVGLLIRKVKRHEACSSGSGSDHFRRPARATRKLVELLPSQAGAVMVMWRTLFLAGFSQSAPRPFRMVLRQAAQV